MNGRDAREEREKELKNLRRMWYQAQMEIGNLTISLEAVIRELEAVKSQRKEITHE